MLHQPDDTISRPVAVRDGRAAPVTCGACGCRLQASGDAWFHFGALGGRDARGCRIGCAEAPHDAHGRPLVLAA